jgi:hypothetical protein
MSTKRKKITFGLLSGLLLVNWTLGMAFIIPPEILFVDKTAGQALQDLTQEHFQVRVIKQNAVLRIKPKNGAVIIKKLPLGALLEVEEEIGDWLKITLPPDEDGFVLTGYLLKSFTEEGSIIHE